MNYKKHYDLLIFTRKNRILSNDCYVEKHHIIPRSLGGSNDQYNLINLTAREHFIAHLLLAKIYGKGMWHAVFMMSNMKRYSNRNYETARKEHAKLVSKLMTNRVVSSFTKERQKETLKRKKQERLDAGLDHYLKGIPKTEDHKNAFRKAMIARGGWVCSERYREYLKIAMKGEGNPMWGKTHTTGTKEIISEANKQKISCPHCLKLGGIAIMKRWHFDNCKKSPNYIKPKKTKRSSPSKETRLKISIGNKGKTVIRNSGNNRTEIEILGHAKSVETRKKNGSYKQTVEQIEKRASRMRGRKIDRILTEDRLSQLKSEKSKTVKCPHCEKEGQCMVMYRWHFDKCKKRSNNFECF